MSVDKEKGHFDGMAESFNQGFSALNEQLESIGRLLHEIKVAGESNVQRIPRKLEPGNTLEINFDAMTVYVDNSQSANPITLTDENGVSFTVPTNTQSWIHPLGARIFDVTGTNPCKAIFFDRFLPIK